MKIKKSSIYGIAAILLIIAFFINHFSVEESYSDNAVLILAIVGFLFGYVTTELSHLLANKKKDSVVFIVKLPRKKRIVENVEQPLAVKRRESKSVNTPAHA